MATPENSKFSDSETHWLDESVTPVSWTHPEDDVIAEHQVLVAAADLSVLIAVVIHLRAYKHTQRVIGIERE